MVTKLNFYLMFLLTTSTINCITHQEVFDIGKQGYTYGYNLVFMAVARNVMLKQSSINQFNRISTAWLDVSKSPVILSVPENPKVEIIDAWTNKVPFPKGSKTYAFVGRSWNGDLSKSFKQIILPTNNAYIKIDIPKQQVKNMDAKTFFTIFSHELKNNPPRKKDSKILDKLKQVGIEVGKDFDASKLSTEMFASLDLGIKQARKEMHEPTNFIK